jgi:molecular chaperone GrpE
MHVEPEPPPPMMSQPSAPISEAISALPSADPPPPAEPPSSSAAVGAGGEERPTSLNDRLVAELRELQDIVNGVESLSYLRSRVSRAIEEGQSDALTLVSFYRLVARSLSEQAEQARRDFETVRSRANKLELELAAAALGQVGAEPGAAQAGGPPSAEAQERITQLETAVTQANEQREKLLVDFKNMRERTQKDLDIKVFRDKEKFFKNFLPVLDSFERAQQSLNESSSVSALLEGFRLIATQLLEALTAEGLQPVDTSGYFDPRFHEAVGEVHNEEKPDEYVFDELSRGYRLGERLIRPAMVRISRNPNMTAPPPAPPEPEGEEPSL